jgi:hypothetical protein
VTTPQKRKGDKAELEVQTICRKLFGRGRRALGAGRLDDVGDIHGIPGVVIQVANYTSLDRAVSQKLDDVEVQMKNAGAFAGSLWCRRRGVKYVVVTTPEQWAALVTKARG